MSLTAQSAERVGLLTVTYLDKLQRANADDLAFYPLTTLANALEDGHVIACEDNGEPAGYLWFGATRGGTRPHRLPSLRRLRIAPQASRVRHGR